MVDTIKVLGAGLLAKCLSTNTEYRLNNPIKVVVQSITGDHAHVKIIGSSTLLEVKKSDLLDYEYPSEDTRMVPIDIIFREFVGPIMGLMSRDEPDKKWYTKHIHITVSDDDSKSPDALPHQNYVMWLDNFIDKIVEESKLWETKKHDNGISGSDSG